MQNNDAVRKWSDLQGMAAVAINTGKKVGTVDDFYFDPAHGTVYALNIKTGVFGHRALLANTISATGQDAITFQSEEVLLEEKSDDQLKTLPLGKSLLTYKVLSEGGTVIGTIGNILIDIGTPGTLRVAAFELAGGLRERLSGHYPTFSSSAVIRYGQDVMVIPDGTAQSLAE